MCFTHIPDSLTCIWVKFINIIVNITVFKKKHTTINSPLKQIKMMFDLNWPCHKLSFTALKPLICIFVY